MPFTCCGGCTGHWTATGRSNSETWLASSIRLRVLFQGSGTAFNKLTLAICLTKIWTTKVYNSLAGPVIARRQWFQSALRLHSDFWQAIGRQISTQTVRNRLHLANLRAYRPAVRPVLTRIHRIARRPWSAEHVTWQLPIGGLSSSQMSLGSVWTSTMEGEECGI